MAASFADKSGLPGVLYIVATEVLGDDKTWSRVHVGVRKTPEGVNRYIEEQRSLDTSVGGLVEPSRAKVRVEVRVVELHRTEHFAVR